MKTKNVKTILVAIVLVFSSSCANETKNLKNVEDLQMKIISLKSNYKEFWKHAKERDIETQIMYWDQYIESPNQEFYDQVVWQKKQDSDWKKIKNSILKKIFPYYENLNPQIELLFENFPKIIKEKLDKFENYLPEPKIDVPIYAALSPWFNGMGASLEKDKEKQLILAFGIDKITKRNDDLGILFSHEFFHIFNYKSANFDFDAVLADGKLSTQLLSEGLAVYVSGLMNPGHTDGQLLMDEKLGKISPNQVIEYAKDFLVQANEKLLDIKNPEIHNRWFSSVENNKFPKIPDRCGYLLGLHVVRHLVKTYTVKEMATWNLNEVHSHVIIALNEIIQL